MQQATLPILSADACNADYAGIGPIAGSQLCAGGGASGACFGDSGGPLTVTPPGGTAPQDDVLVGLVDLGTGCGVGYPDVYTNVADPGVSSFLASDPPQAPDPVGAAQLSAGTAAVCTPPQWSTPVTSVSYQFFQYVSDPNSPDIPLTGAGPDSVFTPTSLPVGTVFYCLVKGSNGGGYSYALSDSDIVTTQAGPSTSTSPAPARPPDAPQNLSTVAGSGSITVSFAPPTDNGGAPVTAYAATATPITGYTVRGDDVLAPPAQATTVRRAAGPITLSGLQNDIPYLVSVTATNAAGTSPPSAQLREVPRAANEVFAVRSASARTDGTAVLQVAVSGPGGLSAVAPGTPGAVSKSRTRKRSGLRHAARLAAAKSRNKTSNGPIPAAAPAMLTRASARAVAAGVVTLTMRPTAAGRALLSRHGQQTVPVVVAYAPADGPRSVVTTSVRLGAPRRAPVAASATAAPPATEWFSFESGTQDWERPWGDLSLASSTAEHFSGTRSMQLTINANNFSAVDSPYEADKSESPFTASLRPGDTVYMWIYRPARTAATVGIRPMVRVGSGFAYCPSPEVFPPANTWTELSVTVPSATTGCGADPGSTGPDVDSVGLQVDDPGGRARGQVLYLNAVSW
jgi:hypothetical protein